MTKLKSIMLYFNSTMFDTCHQVSSGKKGQNEALKDWLLDFLINGVAKAYKDDEEIYDLLERAGDKLRMHNP